MGSELNTYSGKCHCGLNKFSLRIPSPIEEQGVVSCNCSICRINGYLIVYAQDCDMTLDHPENALKEYRFGSELFPHYFCAECGTSLYAKSLDPKLKGKMAVNVRTISDVDIGKLKLIEFDGKSVDPSKKVLSEYYEN